MTNTILRSLLLVASALAPARAQSSVASVRVLTEEAKPVPVVRVHVITEEAKPVRGALVTLWKAPGHYVDLGFTDENGEATRTAPGGTYRLGVSASGFHTRFDTVVVAGPDTVISEVVLQSDRITAWAGMRFGGPAMVSVAVGPSYLVRPALGRRARTLEESHLFLFAEPGIRAGRVSVGYMTIQGSLFVTQTIRASVLRRWSSPDELLVGMEVSGTIAALGPRLGVFTRVAGVRRGSILVFWDFGLGI